jgi:alpha-L-rhamnosidase
VNRWSMLLVSELLCLLPFCGDARAAIQPGRLRCEYMANPQGIDVVAPRLSWILQSNERGERQTAYQVLVATSRDKLVANNADLWDSGQVKGDQSIHVVYAGKPLQTRMQCFWKVRTWDKDGKPSTWSEPASWSMGLLKPDDWQAHWIAAGENSAKPALTPHNGYHSAMAASADTTKWVAVELDGRERSTR